MSRSNRHKEKLEIKSELHPDNSDGETAARTRPFSYDEIMLRRKKKKQSAEVLSKPVDAEILSEEVSKEKVPSRSQSSIVNRNTKLSSIIVAKNSSEDIGKVKSQNNEDNMSKDRIMRKIERDSRDRVIRSKPAMNRDIRDKVERRMDDRRDQWGRSHGNNGNEFERRRSRHLVDREIYADKGRGRPVKIFDRMPRNDDVERKSEREIKRKQRNDDEERRMQQNAVKKHDSGKRYDQEAPERKDPVHKDRKESLQFHNEERKDPVHKETMESLEFRKEDVERKSEREIKRKQRNDDEERRMQQNAVKKHDSGKRYDQEAPERKDPVHKDKKESLQFHKEERKDHVHKEIKDSLEFHKEELKSKKKRSRSRERDKDKGRRSASLSPRSHKRISDNVREHRDVSSHSYKDRFRKEQADDERNRLSNNGSSGRYRRSGGNPSGLGGYSPRKRRTEAAVKTPSPPHLSPAETPAGWDLPPSGTNTNSTVSILPNAQSLSHVVTSNTHELPNIAPITSMPVKAIHGIFSYASVDSVQLTQATRPMRRLYVENLPDSASEKTVMECLNNFLLSSGVNRVPGSQPCISCSIHKEKGQALVEFLTPEDASAALYFDGRYFLGSALKIRRPRDYTDVATGVADKSVVMLDSSSNFVRDSPNKIFIGGIPKILSSEMLREIAAAFGTLKAFHFEANVNLDGPCAFLEYAEESVTLKACAGLNALRLGGQMLTVVQATPGASSIEIFGNPPFYGIPEHAKPLLQKHTQVLKLKNVLNPDDLSSLSEQELEEILGDVRLECARFGTVNSVNVVKRHDGGSMPETCQVPDGTGSTNDEDMNSFENIKSEHIGEQIDDESQETSMLEVPLDSLQQKKEDAKSLEDIGTSAKVITADNVPSLDSSENVVEELACENNPSLTSLDLDQQPVDQNGDRIDENIMTIDAKIETEAIVEEILKTEVTSTEAVSSAGMDSSEVKKVENMESVLKIEDSFEPGSILVEYKRIEASSIAAHYLHGRLFDDRTVTVEYVDYDIYKARFLK